MLRDTGRVARYIFFDLLKKLKKALVSSSQFDDDDDDDDRIGLEPLSARRLNRKRQSRGVVRVIKRACAHGEVNRKFTSSAIL